MNATHLFLDDMRQPSDVLGYLRNPIYLRHDWVVVTSHEAFVEYLLNNPLPAFISFDHDLDSSHYASLEAFRDVAYYDTVASKTGYHSALALVEHCQAIGAELPACACHSLNPYGRANIKRLLGLPEGE